ncbi:AlpA family transcriptional regulator [Microbacterium sp. SORGH_AS_0862]|uniref:helix-turn-helix transcriptional regulator n=1 Tax=Microbacterium sp. SORGH_AS_0862 TaxID=3041789 RepID=UPI00278E6232|nr:hypothetical protein [Microbacterium sp. SORGH_AS_0862]MDQ1206175.1 hypothetical protein [Microbacterium sp. SORGH_AS_0862]
MSVIAPQGAQVIPMRRTATAPEPIWLSPDQVCEIVPGLTPRDLEDMRSSGKGPRYSKPTPRKVVYAQADVHEWLRSKQHGTGEQP